MAKAFRFVLLLFGGLLCLVATCWAGGALYFDLPIAWLRAPLAICYGLAMIAVLFLIRNRGRALGLVATGFGVVLLWWLTIKPSNEGNWQPDGEQLAWADIKGDEVVLHNVRNCDYRTETDYTARWETRTVRVSQITGVDLTMTYWGSPWIAHPIASFRFMDGPPICFSIEVRKQQGQTYSAIGGFYRQFRLIYIVADERDVIRLRTNYRQNEDVYLYRTNMTQAQARERFHQYVGSLNAIREHPRWYNAVTSNCTTAIRDQHPVSARIPWDYRLLLNGKADELMFERGTMVTAGLPFAELKARSLINPRARAADALPNFSELIRVGLPF